MIRISYLVFLFVSSFILAGLLHFQRSNMITKREESTMKQDVAPTSISVLAGILLPPPSISTTSSSSPLPPPPLLNKAQRKCGECGIEGHYKKNCPSLPCSECGLNGHVGSKCLIRIEAAKSLTKEAKRVANMTAEQVEKQREADRIVNMTAEQVEKQREADRIENMTAEQVNQQNKSHRVANMTAEQVNQQNKSHRITNMKPEQVEQQRVSHQVENLPAAQRERKKASDSASKRKRKESGLSGLVGEKKGDDLFSLQEDAAAEIIQNSAVNRDAKRYQASEFNNLSLFNFITLSSHSIVNCMSEYYRTR